MPAVFALADKVIGQPQTSIFAAFGSFAVLVLVEFSGPPRTRFFAYLGLACVGAGIFNDEGRIVAGLSVSAPSDRLRPEWAENVRRTADEISRAMGFKAAA